VGQKEGKSSDFPGAGNERPDYWQEKAIGGASVERQVYKESLTGSF